jgi:cold shock CspA family protein
MGRSQESFNKKEVRKKKEQKRKEKEKKKLERKESEKKSSLDDMIAYVDEDGNITSEPPDPEKKTEVKLEDIEISAPKKSPGQDISGERRGTVTFFDESKGFGFIKDAELQEDVFVHISNLQDSVDDGTEVAFELETGPKGLVAVNVKRV